ncbi:MAG: branched-chain amino acid ABC transporter permease, partial [Desulfovibrionaceae bacterium]|nr:branched-chain amino acid ABC transporter permease [Desulfovibrionaceae bacterium]
MQGLKKDLLLTGAFLSALCLAPWVLPSGYYLTVLIMCCLNAMTVVGLNLLLGYAGQISLGHAAFYGLAAYTTAILTTTLGLPVALGMLAGVGL